MMTNPCGFCGLECDGATCAECAAMVERYERNTIQLASDIVRMARELTLKREPREQ